MEKKENPIAAMLQQFAPLRGGKHKYITLEPLALQWLDTASLRVKESSYVKYYNLVQNHILPDLGDCPLERLTTTMVYQFVQGKLNNGRRDGRGGLSEKTVKDMLMVLREICLYAAHWEIEIPCHFELIRIRRKEMEVRILTRQNQVELERFLMADNSLSRIGIQLSLYMGLRLGEVCALKRRHISYREALLQVRFTMQRIQDLSENAAKKTKIIVTEPKSSSSIRDIPIPDFLMERLQILRDMPRDAYILTGSTNFFIEPRTLENILKKYLRECRMEHTNYHVLRHTFATRCIEEGFDAKSLSEILGHSNVNITLNRYVHSSLEQKRKNMEKLEPSCL